MTEYPTSLGTSDADSITLMGQDLAADLMGKVGFGELVFWLVTQRRPTPSEVRVFESVLVALADHGFTPTAIAARLTYLSAPDSLQGAIAAGILGGGSRFLGVTEDCAQYLAGVLAPGSAAGGEVPADDAALDVLARDAVRRARADKKFIPGLGHPVHKVLDPRTPRLIEIATEEGLRGRQDRLVPGDAHRGPPDVLVLVGSDHFHQLWLDNMPQFLNKVHLHRRPGPGKVDLAQVRARPRRAARLPARIRPAAIPIHTPLSGYRHLMLDSGKDTI